MMVVIESNKRILKLAQVLLTLVGLCVYQVNALSSVKKGWKTRPLVPELSRSDKDDDDVTLESKNDKKREPWDALRFVQQSSKFVSMPQLFSSKGKTAKVIQPNTELWKAGSNSLQWAPLDDVVMGGVSSSIVDNDTGIWSGTVSDANSGGFVGIRTTPLTTSLDMSDCSGIELYLRGNGSPLIPQQRFKIIIRDSTDFNGVCWTSSFDIPSSTGKQNNIIDRFLTSLLPGNDDDEEKNNDNDVIRVKIPFEELIPTIFAKTVPDQTLQKENIVGFQFAYSKVCHLNSISKLYQLSN